MEDIKVSVVITVYNIEKYIGECIESVLNQSLKEIEVICVDDASTDGSLKILREYAARDNRVVVIENQCNKGSASSRNIGCRAARGKYLYIIDGDDLVVEGALEKLFGIAQDNRLDILNFNGETFCENGLEHYGDVSYKKRGNYNGIYRGVVIFGELMHNDSKWTWGNLYLNFFDRDFFVANNLYGMEGSRYTEEVFLIYAAAKRVMLISDVLYRRRFRENSVITAQPKGNYMPVFILQFLKELEAWDRCGEIDERTDSGIEKYFLGRHMSINRMYQLTIEEQKDHEVFPLTASKKALYFYRYFVKRQPLLNCILEEDLERIKSADNRVVYGAGQYGIVVADILEHHGINDYKVAVSRLNGKEGTFRGKEISAIADLDVQNDNTIVIIAAGGMWQGEMAEVLKQLGCKNYVLCRERE